MGEGVDDRQAFDFLAVLQILRKKMRATEFKRRSKEETIPPSVRRFQSNGACS
jgi:hypothetical protein